MRILGIDHGTKRIGIAISDEDGRLAVPLTVVDGTDQLRAVREIVALIAEEQVGRVLIGMPYAVEREAGEQSIQEKIVAVFIDALKKEAAVPIETIDERFTTREAEYRMDDVHPKFRAQKDALAASILLQAYLDSKMSKE